MCNQQRLRPACAYAQTDQSLCWSCEYYISVKLLTEHRLEFLSLKGGCTDSSESTLVKMPHSCLFVLWLQVRIQRGNRGSGTPGKSQVIWVSTGNKQLDPTPLEKVGPPLEKVGPPSGTLKMIVFFGIDHLTSVK